MNPDQPSRDQIETRLTALLLGELPADEAALLRYTMAQDPALQQLHDELQATLGLVREAAKHPAAASAAKNAPPALKLSSERRQQLLAHFQTPRPKASPQPLFWLKRIELPRLVPVLIAVASIALLAAMLLPALSKAKTKSQRARATSAMFEPNVVLRSLEAGKELRDAMVAKPVPPPSSAPVAVSLAPEPQLPPPPVATPPVEIVLPQSESESEIAGQAGAPIEVALNVQAPGNASPQLLPPPTPAGSVPKPGAAAAGQMALNYSDSYKTVDKLDRPEHLENQWTVPAQVFDGGVSLNGAARGAGGGGGAIVGSFREASGDNKELSTFQPAGSTLSGQATPPAVAPPPFVGSPTPVLALNDASAGQFKHSALQSGAVGGVAGNRFYRSPAQESEQKKVPVLGDVATLGPQFQRSLNDNVGVPAAPPAPVAAPTPSAASLPAFEFEGGAPAISGRTPDSSASDRDDYRNAVTMADKAKRGQAAQVSQNLNQPASRSPQSSSASQNSLLQRRSVNANSTVGAVVAFNTAPVPDAGDFKLGVASDSFKTEVAKEEPPFPVLATAGSVNLLEENKSLDAERTRALQKDQVKPSHNLPGDADPAWIGVLDNNQPGQKTSGVLVPQNGNHFVSRYAYAAPMSARVDQLQVTNAVAVIGGAYNTFSPGTSAIVPNTIQQGETIDQGGASVPAEYMSEVIPIRHAKVGDIASALNKLNGKEIQLFGQTKIIPNESSSSLLIYATQADMKAIKGAVAKLDTETLAAEKTDLPLRKPAPNAPVPQPEILTQDNNFSTFSLNVSDVSFKFAEASLQNGKLPDTASIRSEEFINAFDYRDPEAAAGQPMAFTSERARYPFAHNRELLRFAVKTAAAGRPAGRALNLVLLLDRSGSMERADRVAIIRESLRVLATQLQPQDTVSVVTFARTARLWADGISGDKAGATLDQVGGITPEGGTNLEEAMRLAYETAHHHYLPNGLNRVVLLTDGAANLGTVEPEALKQKVEAQRKQGIALDCFGIGWEDYNDDLLEQLSSNGDGRYAFLNSPENASKDFATKLAGALQIAAADVKVQVEFNPSRVVSYRQIGYARHQLTKEQFRDNSVAAGEIAAQEAGNALYTIETNPTGDGPIATVHVRYRIPGTSDYREHSWDVAYTGGAPALDQSSPAMRLAATASAFSEWLAASPYAQEVTLDELLKILSGVPEVYGADDRPKQLETMIREAKSLEGKSNEGRGNF